MTATVARRSVMATLWTELLLMCDDGGDMRGKNVLSPFPSQPTFFRFLPKNFTDCYPLTSLSISANLVNLGSTAFLPDQKTWVEWMAGLDIVDFL